MSEWRFDSDYEGVTLAEVRDEGKHIAVTRSDGWSFGWPHPGWVPAVGDTARFYGRGIGFIVRGVVVFSGDVARVVYYRSEFEQQAENDRQLAKAQAEREAALDAERDDRDRRWAALPEQYRARLARFTAAKGDDWRRDHESYELFCCEQGHAIAEAMRQRGTTTADDMTRFHRLPWQEQRALVPAIDDGHSGNTFGMACRLALWELTRPENVAREHGALSAACRLRRLRLHAPTIAGAPAVTADRPLRRDEARLDDPSLCPVCRCLRVPVAIPRGHAVSSGGRSAWASLRPVSPESRIAMSDPTPTDVQALVDRLRERQADFEMVARHGICVQSTPERLAGEYQEAADALTALRLDVQRITEERDEARQSMLDANGRAADRLEAINELDAELDQLKADRDAQVREGFDAGWHAGWDNGAGRSAIGRLEAFAAYLRDRQDGKETAK
jgi:hypothetical protein